MGSMGLELQLFPASSTICLRYSCSTWDKREKGQKFLSFHIQYLHIEFCIHFQISLCFGMRETCPRRTLSEEGSLLGHLLLLHPVEMGWGHTAEHRWAGPARTAGLTPPAGIKEQPQELLPALSARTGWGMSQHAQSDPLGHRARTTRGGKVRHCAGGTGPVSDLVKSSQDPTDLVGLCHTLPVMALLPQPGWPKRLQKPPVLSLFNPRTAAASPKRRILTRVMRIDPTSHPLLHPPKVSQPHCCH